MSPMHRITMVAVHYGEQEETLWTCCMLQFSFFLAQRPPLSNTIFEGPYWPEIYFLWYLFCNSDNIFNSSRYCYANFKILLKKLEIARNGNANMRIKP